MNIFVLELDVEKCARYHADQHVVMMILESALMLCTVLDDHGIDTPYRATHRHHPCTRWTGESLNNWKWLKALALCLNQEYRWRYQRKVDHKSAVIINELPLPPIEAKGLTEFAQAMPDEYKVTDDAVRAYRNYYISEKAAFATWTRREMPQWFIEGLKMKLEQL